MNQKIPKFETLKPDQEMMGLVREAMRVNELVLEQNRKILEMNHVLIEKSLNPMVACDSSNLDTDWNVGI